MKKKSKFNSSRESSLRLLQRLSPKNGALQGVADACDNAIMAKTSSSPSSPMYSEKGEQAREDFIPWNQNHTGWFDGRTA